MTEKGARTAANLMLIVAGVAVAYAIWTRPSLRRLALYTARWWLGASVPVYLITEVRQAWVETAKAA